MKWWRKLGGLIFSSIRHAVREVSYHVLLLLLQSIDLASKGIMYSISFNSHSLSLFFQFFSILISSVRYTSFLQIFSTFLIFVDLSYQMKQFIYHVQSLNELIVETKSPLIQMDLVNYVINVINLLDIWLPISILLYKKRNCCAEKLREEI